MEEYKRYLNYGLSFTKENEPDISKLDSTGVHRASMLHASGLYYYILGNYFEAIEIFEKIADSRTNLMTDDIPILHSTCNYLGQSYNRLARFDRAILYFERANNMVPRDHMHYNYYKALYHMYVGQFQYISKDTDESFVSFHKAINLLEKEKDINSIRNALKSNYLLIASYFFKSGQYDSALFYAEKSGELHVTKDPFFTTTYSFIGDVYYQLHEPDSALKYYQLCIESVTSIYDSLHYLRSEPLKGIGNIERDKFNFEEAKNKYFESLLLLVNNDTSIANISWLTTENLNSIVLPTKGINILYELAKLHYDWFKYDNDVRNLDSCLSVLESALYLNDISRKELVTMNTKETRARKQAQLTELGIEASYAGFRHNGQSTYQEKTIYFIEKSKSNILFDQVQENRAISYSGLPGELIKYELALKGELSLSKNKLLKRKRTDPQFSQLKSTYEEKQREYINLISELEEKYPDYYELKYADIKIRTEDLQRSIPTKHQLILQYYMGAENIYIAAITRIDKHIEIISYDSILIRTLEVMIKQISNPNITEYENSPNTYNEFILASEYLYGKILLPALEKFDKSIKELIIIPDGILYFLPFEVLLTQKSVSEHIDYASLPYLVNKYQVSYEYSLLLLFENLKLKPVKGDAYLGYAPSYFQGNYPSSSEDYRAQILTPLIGNQAEVKKCCGIWKGVSFIGKEATELAFRDHVSNANIIHLATHTLINNDSPQESSFAFEPGTSEEYDGFLYTHELYNMNINSNLVVLSGCETGIGKNKKGEGILSLARAFKYAGCSNMLISLWKVNDNSTKEIIVSFNENLKKGMEKDEALRQAKISYLQGYKNLHPFYWSGFILIGNEYPIDKHTKSRVILMLLIASATGLFGIWMIKTVFKK